jgi:hypothetical protein
MKGVIVMFPNENLLLNLVSYIISGGGAGVIVYWLLTTPVVEGFVLRVSAWVEKAIGLNASQLKRIVAGVLSTVFSVGAFCIGALIAPELMTLPVNVVEWINLVLYLGGLSFGISQVVHLRDLKARA